RCDKPVLVEDNKVATHLYRIAQEAVSNAIRHGRAKRIEIRLSQKDGALLLSIQDNGTGLPPDLAGRKGMGLRIMSYRAGMIGAFLTIENRTRSGAQVICSFPTESLSTPNI
ncbi:MAG: histidine kinase, partial [Pedosphaera parvula]|nr:histidine kinase [Pedosphaera parvula]